MAGGTSSTKVTVEGDEQARADLRAFGRMIPRAVDDDAVRLAQPVASGARASVPYLTGALASSIRVGPAEGGAEITMGSGNVPYAAWIEYGGSRNRPYVPEGRYLMPALDDQESHIVDGFERSVTDTIGAFSWHQSR